MDAHSSLPDDWAFQGTRIQTPPNGSMRQRGALTALPIGPFPAVGTSHGGLPLEPQGCTRVTSAEDFDDVAVLDHVFPADSLALEPGGSAPDSSTAERCAQVVMDAVGDVGHRRSGVERRGLRVD